MLSENGEVAGKCVGVAGEDEVTYEFRVIPTKDGGRDHAASE